YQRTGRLLVRLFEEEEDLSVYVLLDSSASMGFGEPTKLHYGKQLAAALAYVALAHLDRVSVLTFADAMTGRLAPTRGKNRIFRVFEFLEPLRADGRTGLADSMRAFAAQSKRRGIAIVISDLYDPAGFEEGINQLRFAKFEPHVIHLFDRRELAPDLHGDVQLVDHETGEVRDVTITRAVLDRYAEAHAAYRRRIEEFCREKQVAYHAVDTSIPFDEVVLRILRQGGTLG
ncbi:MAG: VWA domain-containing protein, partial [Polyangiaceae bacterium]|nr:VWA domain-containing protein [Polyangiaceae bacterium]